QEADLCRIGIVLAGGQINGMSRSMPVARRSVRQETLLAIGPQQRIEGLHPALARGLLGGPPAALERHLEQRGQVLFESAAFEMIEVDFGYSSFAHADPRAFLAPLR